MLKQLDFVIASVHSHMDMDRCHHDRADHQGHPQSLHHHARPSHRPGTALPGRPYEVDHGRRCPGRGGQVPGVTVELNANPMRLDLDWRLMPRLRFTREAVLS
ncbi:MAG: hypothetical protein MZV70_37145 [Desulfobacterales bacterium]|nr:hypothetical protein [Desulfobacterales bacterium]